MLRLSFSNHFKSSIWENKKYKIHNLKNISNEQIKLFDESFENC